MNGVYDVLKASIPRAIESVPALVCLVVLVIFGIHAAERQNERFAEVAEKFNETVLLQVEAVNRSSEIIGESNELRRSTNELHRDVLDELRRSRME